jgi:hypothetical protein
MWGYDDVVQNVGACGPGRFLGGHIRPYAIVSRPGF